MCRADCRREGSLLVVVLVVLLVIGMLVSQGMRLLMTTARAQSELLRLEQARELVELGKLRWAKRITDAHSINETDVENEQADAFTVTLRPRTDETLPLGNVRIKRVQATGQDQVGRWIIEARYPYNQPSEIVASWESP